MSSETIAAIAACVSAFFAFCSAIAAGIVALAIHRQIRLHEEQWRDTRIARVAPRHWNGHTLLIANERGGIAHDAWAYVQQSPTAVTIVGPAVVAGFSQVQLPPNDSDVRVPDYLGQPPSFEPGTKRLWANAHWLSPDGQREQLAQWIEITVS